MAKVQPNQNAEPVIETEAIESPVVQEEKKEPVIETEDMSGPVSAQKVVEKIKEQTGLDVVLGTRPETDRKLSHEKRILAFLETRHTGDYVKLNDFLKSLYPIPKGNEKALWTTQGAMRKLRQGLHAMKDRGEIVFSNNNFDRLGDNYHVGEERIRKDYNIGDLIIEAKLAF